MVRIHLTLLKISFISHVVSVVDHPKLSLVSSLKWS
jgi:hypothetical protein